MGSPHLDDAILLFGMPRSGTTWIGKIFDSHPQTLYRHEPDSEIQRCSLPLLPDVSQSHLLRGDLDDFLRSVAATRTPKVTCKRPLFPKSYRGPINDSLHHVCIYTALLASRVGVELHVPDLLPVRHENVRLVWKSIESLGRLGLLTDYMPNVTPIVILRHPCGYVASTLRGEAGRKFGSDTATSDDFGLFESLLETDQARRRKLTLERLMGMKPVERLAWRWTLFNEKALEELAKLNRHRIVVYEKVCENPVLEIKELFAFTGLSWSRQTEGFLYESTSRNDDGFYSIFKDPLSAANRWRESMDRSDIDRVEAVVSQSVVYDYFNNDLRSDM